MNFNMGLAILERISGAVRLPRELAFFPHRDKANPEPIGHRRAEDEPPRVDPDDLIGHFITRRRKELIDGGAEQFAAP